MDAMTKTHRLTRLTYRLFLFAWIFAVLWVKGYLWLIFIVAVFLALLDGYLSAQLEASRAARAEAAKPRARPGGRRPKKTADAGGEPSWASPSRNGRRHPPRADRQSFAGALGHASRRRSTLSTPTKACNLATSANGELPARRRTR